MLVTIIAGARPNFMKIAPIIDAIEKARITGQNIDYRLIHTGQHYDVSMAGRFFQIRPDEINRGARPRRPAYDAPDHSQWS